MIQPAFANLRREGAARRALSFFPSGNRGVQPNLIEALRPRGAVGEPEPPTRDAIVGIAERARSSGKPAYVFVNDGLEGHAPTTIEVGAEALDRGP